MAARRAAAASDALRSLQCEVLEAIAAAQKLPAVGTLLCHAVERLAPGIVCSVLAIDAEDRLRPIAGPSLPGLFSAAIDGLPIGPDVGSCGAAACLRQPIEARDIATDPRWLPYNVIPLAAGLRACWSSPILHRDGRVLGTFAFYFRTCRGPGELERQIVDTCVHLCALAIEQDEVWHRLRQTNERFDAALDNMSQGVCFFDGERRLIVANRRYCEIYGLAPGSIGPGTTLEHIVALRLATGSGPRMPSNDYLDWRRHLQQDVAPSDTLVELANGRFIAIHHRPMPDSGWVATHEDVTERRRAEAQITHMARHDALTGLANRYMFHETLHRAMSAENPDAAGCCVVICVDLDHFKAVNDTFGHAAGDQLLKRVAHRLTAAVRDVDTVTRLGGDEFAVVLTEMDAPRAAADVARRIVAAFEKPFELDGHSVATSASLGIAIAPQDGTSPEALMKSADAALYWTKRDDRGGFRFFEPGMDHYLVGRRILERELQQAVRDQSFQIAYQPLFDVATGAIAAFEALLRWPHPARGLVPPAEFIPAAEETGLIVPLGAWVLRQACEEAMRWPDGVKVAVNLSAAQFRHNTLVRTVTDALQRTGLAPQRLELEITESLLLHNTEENLATLHALHALGIRVSLDDFGTGYSSLSYLRRFPFDKIKIDRSFIQDITDANDALLIVRAIIGLGLGLGMQITAEGVETREQYDQLAREGCTEIQGFLLGAPVSAARARLMLEGGRPARATG